MQTALPEKLLLRIRDVLDENTGLHFPAGRMGDLERGISMAARELGMADTETCAQRLVAAPLSRREIDVLAGCLTVGETYFFREKHSLEALQQHILPVLLQQREKGDKRLRIWSAGCCTGEEPYSIAMLLERLIPDIDDWNITLLATDINPGFLRKAVAAEYGEWSFRATPEWIRGRYFQPGKDGSYKLDARISKRVTFSWLNLASDVYPSLASNTNAMDIIFCCNVLMYFSMERMRAVIDGFYRSLVDGGYLIVSPAETSTSLFSRFSTVELDGAIIYRKHAGKSGEANSSPDAVTCPMHIFRFADEAGTPESPRMAEETALPGVQPPLPALPLAEAGLPPLPPLPLQRNPADAARECANRGQLDEAAGWCCRAIDENKLDPGHHYLLAIIRQEQGHIETAVQSLRRALYLDPEFVLAEYMLGNLRQMQGRNSEANRHFGNALDTLRACAPDAILPESEGLTAGRLMEIILDMRVGHLQEPLRPE